MGVLVSSWDLTWAGDLVYNRTKPINQNPHRQKGSLHFFASELKFSEVIWCCWASWSNNGLSLSYAYCPLWIPQEIILGNRKFSKQIFAETPSDQNKMWNGHRHFFLNTPSHTTLFKVRGREGEKSSATRTFDGKSTWFCRHERSQYLDLLRLIKVWKIHPEVFTVLTLHFRK